MVNLPQPPCPLLHMLPARTIAAACQLSMRSLRRAIARGQFPTPIRIRGRMFFLASDLEAWLDQQRHPGDAPAQEGSTAQTTSAS